MAVLEAKGVSVSLGESQILTNCGLTVEPGEFVGIIGQNGSGKTTFLKAMRGLIPMTAGEVRINGKLLSELSEKETAREVAYMQQTVQLGFGYTAHEIVMAARYPYLKWWENERPEDFRVVENVMKQTGTWESKDQPVNTMSGGERQRVFLAKTLAQETNLLFLDEPTAALDLVHADAMFRYCRSLCDGGKSIVVVVHDLEMAAKFCTRLVLLGNGGIVAAGTPKEVLTADNLARAFKMASCVYEDPYFDQLRIYVYPKDGQKSTGLRGATLPPGATEVTRVDSDM